MAIVNIVPRLTFCEFLVRLANTVEVDTCVCMDSTAN